MLRPIVFAAALLGVAVASPVMAESYPDLRFITDVQTNAAKSGIDAERVIRSNDRLTIIGTDQTGKRATLVASCSRSHIACTAPRGPVVMDIAVG